MLKSKSRRTAVLVSVSAVLALTASLAAWAQDSQYPPDEVEGTVITAPPDPDTGTGTPGPEVEPPEETLADEVVADPEVQDEVTAESLPFTGFNTDVLVLIGGSLLIAGTALVIRLRPARGRHSRP